MMIMTKDKSYQISDKQAAPFTDVLNSIASGKGLMINGDKDRLFNSIEALKEDRANISTAIAEIQTTMEFLSKNINRMPCALHSERMNIMTSDINRLEILIEKSKTTTLIATLSMVVSIITIIVLVTQIIKGG